MEHSTELWPDYRAEWMTWMRVSRNHLPNTVKLYARTVERMIEDLGDPLALTDDDLRIWVEMKGGSASTVSNRISALASYYRYLRKRKLILVNPTDDLDRPKRHKNLPKPVRDLELALASLDRLDIKVGRRVGETRDMVVVLCETGLRIHEAVALNVPVPAPDTLKVHGKGAKDAIIPLTDKARAALDRLGGTWPIGARATQRRFEKANPAFSPHQCRHWRGTSMAEAGADLGDIKAMLRHENMQTTLGYAAWSTDRVRDALAKVPA